MSRFIERVPSLAALLPLTVAGAIGCAESTPDDDDAPATYTTEVRVLHLSPDAPAVDVFADGAEIASDLAYGEGTGYLEVDEANYDLAIAPAGAGSDAAVLEADGVSLVRDNTYSVIAYDALDEIKAMVLEDDYAGLDDGFIRVRPVHTAAAVGEVDIWAITDAGASMLYEDVPFGAAGSYIDLPAATYTLGFDADDDAVPDLVFELPALSAGTVANVFALSDTDRGVYLLAQLQDGTTATFDATPIELDPAMIRVLHLSPDAGFVDVWVDDAILAVEGLGFGAGTGYLELDPGSYTFDVTAAGGDPMDAVLTVADLPLDEGMSYTAVAYDEAAEIKAMALVDDFKALAAGDIRVRAIHAASIVGTVDIWEVSDRDNPIPLYTSFEYGAVGDYLDLPAGAYELGFDLDADASPDVTFTVPELAAGTVANVFAVSDIFDNVFLLAQLQDGTVARINPDAPPAMTYVRVLHLSPDAGVVDVWAGMEAVAVDDLDFQQGTGYLELEEGSYSFYVTADGGMPADAALAIEDLPLAGDAYYTAVAYGPAASIGALALQDAYGMLQPGDIRVRAIHTASMVGQVDIWEISDPMNPLPLYVDFDYGQVGGYLDLPAGAYNLGFDVNDDAVPDVTFAIPSLPAGTVANVFAVTGTMGDVFLLAQLEDGATVRIDPT